MTALPHCPLCGGDIASFCNGKMVDCIAEDCLYCAWHSDHRQLAEQAAKAKAWERLQEEVAATINAVASSEVYCKDVAERCDELLADERRKAGLE